MRFLALAGMAILVLAASSPAQNQASNSNAAVKRGEQVFAQSCATGYCHGARGGAGGAPRLAARGFSLAYVNEVVTRGIPDSGMPSFAEVLSKVDLAAVVAYVATLNGVANPGAGADSAVTGAPVKSLLTGEAARGALLFTDAVRGFGRCSTCHQIGGRGISVAPPIAEVPVSVAALKALTTPGVKTGALDGESMPVLVLSDGAQSTLFYDLTSVPPVQRNELPGSVKFSAGSTWRHSSVIGAYDDAELRAILAYLRAAI
jgi:mono/diheme cytochrome c family protein